MREHKVEIFADYFNFYLQDDGTDDYVDPDSDSWIAVGEGVARVTTARNMNVPVTVEVHEAEPAADDAVGKEESTAPGTP